MVRSALCACALLAQMGVAHAAVPREVLHDTDVVVDNTWIRETEATVYVAVSGARGLTSSEPVTGARVTLRLVPAEKPPAAEPAPLATAVTGDDGTAVVRLRVPAVPPGRYHLVVDTRSGFGTGRITRPVEVTDRTHLHLRTDRGVYKPGQIIRWRISAIGLADAHPLDREIELTIKDPRGTAIWRGSEETDDTGMVAGEVPLGDDITLGSYTLIARAGEVTASEKVLVRAFRLAPFAVRIEPVGKRPVPRGEPLRLRVVANYPYGEPVLGGVSLAAGSNLGRLSNQSGNLDQHGSKSFTVKLPGDATRVELEATVVDGSGERQRAELKLPVASDTLAVGIALERPQLVAGQTQWVTVITTDGAGHLAPAKVWLRVPGRKDRVMQQSDGAVRFPIVVGAGSHQLRASAVDAAGRVASAERKISVYPDNGHWIRVAQAVVRSGAPIRISGRWRDRSGPVVVTLLRQGAPLASRVAEVDRRGRLHATLFPPAGLFGLATVRVTGLGWNQHTGDVTPTYDQASIYLAPARLAVTVSATTRHRPGTRAGFEVAVADSYGRPVPGVGLAASVVDERVLALSERRPDLVQVLRTLDVEHAEAAGVLFADLVRAGDGAAAIAAQAIIQALPPDRRQPAIQLAAADRFRAELSRMTRAEKAVYDLLLVAPRRLGRRDRAGRWEFADRLPELLVRAGWTLDDRLTPWRRATDWGYARQLLPEWRFDLVAARIVQVRLDRLDDRLVALRKTSHRLLHRDPTGGLATLVGSGKLDRYLILDPWGTPIRVDRIEEQNGVVSGYIVSLASAGPDLKFRTADDVTRYDVFGESTLGVTGTGYGGGGSGYGTIGAGRYGTIGHGGGMGSGLAPLEVAVRKRFDETVLWVAGVKTGADGKARFEVPLADSVTGWEVAVEAISPHGSVGTATARMETFLPLHVDAELPARLTVGDRYVVTAVVANHTGSERRLAVTATATGAVGLTGDATAAITLPAGTTGALRFPLVGRRAGTGTVRLGLADGHGAAVDVVERTLEIEPPGALVRELRTGRVRDGHGSFSIEIPSSAVPATVGGRLRLFRGPADQALDGLEGMLREPYGCFEQASSTTYPNLLVLELLGESSKTAAARKRARELVGKGYQRLISYEVPGGGFSWFGEAPANQVLTAYGLMEFVDMARVYPIDPSLVERTRRWLLGKQGKDGAWRPDASWLHDWSAVQGQVSTTAYIAWALAESGYRGKPLTRALGFLRRHRHELTENPYLLALWAAAESAVDPGSAVVGELRRRGRHDGDKLRVSAGGETLFYARGDGADVQVTALAASALHRGRADGDAAAALAWVWSARSPSYGWGTTQGTVLALRAAAELADPGPPASGVLRVAIDGVEVGTIDLAAAGVPGVALPAGLKPGRHTVTVDGEVAGTLSADLRYQWRGASEPVATAAGLAVALTAKQTETRVGESLRLTATVSNPGRDQVAMPTVVIPVPPGFRADPDALQRLVSGGTIAKYEDQGSEIQLYLTRLAGKGSVTLPVALEAIAECQVTQRPAAAYAYYDPETRGTSVGLRLTAGPRPATR